MKSSYEIIDEVYMLQTFLLQEIHQDNAIPENFISTVDNLATAIQTACKQNIDATISTLFCPKSTDISFSTLHSINTAILCEVLALKEEWIAEKRLSLLSAALTMDISIYQARNDVYSHKGFDIELYKNHARLSYNQLRQGGVDDNLWLDAVLHHHTLKIDRGLGVDPQKKLASTAARMLSVTQLYAEQIMERAYRPTLPPHKVVQTLMMDNRIPIDIPLFEKLIAEIGVFPPGTLLQLHTKNTAIVTQRGVNHEWATVTEFIDNKGNLLKKPHPSTLYKIIRFITHRSITNINMRKFWAIPDEKVMSKKDLLAQQNDAEKIQQELQAKKRQAELDAAKKEQQQLQKQLSEKKQLAELDALKRQQERDEEDRKRREELDAEKQRLAKIEADKKAQQEQQRQAKIKQQQLAKIEAEKKAKAEQQRLANIEADKKAKAEQQRLEKIEADKKAQQEQEQQLKKAEADKKAEQEKQARQRKEKKLNMVEQSQKRKKPKKIINKERPMSDNMKKIAEEFDKKIPNFKTISALVKQDKLLNKLTIETANSPELDLKGSIKNVNHAMLVLGVEKFEELVFPQALDRYEQLNPPS